MKNIGLFLALFFLVGFYLKAQTTANVLTVHDTRNVNDAPNFLSRSLRIDFKDTNVIGVPGGGGYSSNITIAPWTDATGGLNHQLNFNDGGIYYRTGSYSLTTWNPWKKFIIESDGKVGIGTNNLSANLHVYGAVNPNIILQGPISRLELGVATNNGAYAPFAQVGDIVYRPLGAKHGLIFLLSNDNNDGTSYIKFGDCANEGWVTIFNNRTMRIDGQLFAKEIKIQSNVWSDHVFCKDYRLRSIEEVKEFIETNNHLPDIPSEQEVRENGVDLGDMQAKLLQKIEELTLYLINQDKSIHELQKSNQELQNEIEQLKRNR